MDDTHNKVIKTSFFKCIKKKEKEKQKGHIHSTNRTTIYLPNEKTEKIIACL